MQLSKMRKSMMKVTTFCGGAILAFSVQAGDLNQIQKQIKLQEQKIAEQKREQNKLQSTLKNQENKINDVVGNLRETETNLKETKRIIAETNKQIQRLGQQEKAQKAKLAKQLDAIYRSGNPNSVVEHLLSDDASKNDRMMVYAKHMNQARLNLLADLKATRAQLENEKAELANQQKLQQTQLSEHKKQRQELQKAQNERQSTLNQINKNLERDQNKLNTLKENENALRNEIARAAQAAEQQEKREREQLAQKKQAEEKRTNRTYQPTEQEQQLIRSGGGLAGKYPRPVNGSILNSYGSTQVGEVKWKGIVIAAPAGTAVKAIAGGRVILASWLSGYGQVVVIEHGKGYMSLYGYNQAVFVRSGALVNAGQKIAEVGNSGGQGRSALYFEIRRQGNAVNPMNWLR